MDIIVSFFICFILLILSVLRGINIMYPLIIMLIIFSLLALFRGYKISKIIHMIYKGGKKSFIVIQVFILIGAITSTWMACGTVPAIVLYGLKFMNPKYFLLYAFLICSLVSFLIGTSFGTVGTVGMALMVMARGGGMNPAAAAGAIFAGAYFGDRCSPMSSSANLVAVITDTKLYRNIKNMLITGLIPFILSCFAYFILSYIFTMKPESSSLSDNILREFIISPILLLPAAIVLIFSIFRFDVKVAMLLSTISATIITVFIQNKSLPEIVHIIIFGFKLNNSSPLSQIIKGGGLISMINVAIVVFVSSAFSGIFEETGMLKNILTLYKANASRSNRFLNVFITSIATSIFGCSQALSVILTEILCKDSYINGFNKESGKYDLAVDLENTAIVISPLVPWNIASLVPLTTLMVGSSALFYSFYLYLLPCVTLVTYFLRERFIHAFRSECL